MTTKKGLNDNKVMHTLIYFIQKIHYIIKKPKTYLRNTKFIINLISEIATFNLCFYIDSNLHPYSKDQNYYFNYKIQVRNTSLQNIVKYIFLYLNLIIPILLLMLI